MSVEPKRVFEIFEEFSLIPHGSGNTQKATAFCMNFAAKLGLKAITDEAGNVVIYKAASKGYETHAPVILQGHLDMVCEKTADKVIDFEKEGLSLQYDGDFLFADGTTLGGDDGIAVAMILAVLEDDTLPHPPLEAVFTTNEETGMDGARFFDCSVLKGKTMLNLDSEDEETLWVSCAGGARTNIDIPVERESILSAPTFEIKLAALCGGHSGTEIDKGHLNGVITLGKVLKELSNEIPFGLCEFKGGLMDNAIPRECVALITCNKKDALFTAIENAEKKLKQIAESDPDLTLTVKETECRTLPLADKSKGNILDFLSEVPNGVIAMSKEIEGLVETSLNLGIMKLEDSIFHVSFSVRSSVNSEKDRLCEKVKEYALCHKGTFAVNGAYPAWEYRENSPLRTVMNEEYKKLNGKDAELRAIHAGLECGIFFDKIENLDCVSFGPNIFDIHTPDEKLSISSANRVFTFLKNTLKSL